QCAVYGFQGVPDELPDDLGLRLAEFGRQPAVDFGTQSRLVSLEPVLEVRTVQRRRGTDKRLDSSEHLEQLRLLLWVDRGQPVLVIALQQVRRHVTTGDLAVVHG